MDAFERRVFLWKLEADLEEMRDLWPQPIGERGWLLWRELNRRSLAGTVNRVREERRLNPPPVRVVARACLACSTPLWANGLCPLCESKIAAGL